MNSNIKIDNAIVKIIETPRSMEIGKNMFLISEAIRAYNEKKERMYMLILFSRIFVALDLHEFKF